MDGCIKCNSLATHIQTFRQHLVLLIVINLLSLSTCQISPDEMKNVANFISAELKKKFAHTGYKHFEDQFRTGFTNGDFIVNNVDISKVSEKFSRDLGTSLINNIDSVRRIRDRAIELERNYKYDEDLLFTYRNDKDNLTVQPAPTFAKGMDVNLTNSFVQVPTNIYRSSKVILNNAYWTRMLDETFTSNFKKTPSLMWQYFGCETGMIRNFPGLKGDPDTLDTYDCRRRPWYNQAINSPKDIIIVLDLSGSMAGNNFQIAKLAVKSLIDNFNQDDFFNVVYYNTSAYLLVPCMKKLTQATTFKKSHLKAAVDGLHPPQGEADASRGLRLAFETLTRSRGSAMTSSMCSQVVMLISDEMERCDETDAVLKEYNQNKTITIFSYVIGQSESNAQTLKSISCNNGAQTYRFRTIGTVWNEVLKFQGILSHPLAKLNQEYIVFTPLYWDWFGLGMMTTISTSVFSKNNATTQTPTLLGVAAVDIRIAQLEENYPRNTLGVFGYAFAINNNGFFLMHPHLRDQNGDSSPPTVYLHELEYTTNPNKSIELERRMINNEKGCFTTEIYNLFPRNVNKRLAQVNATYCYEPIVNTTFRSGIAIPIVNQVYTQANKKESLKQLQLYTNALVSRKEGYKVEIAAWRFCEFPAAEQKDNAASKRLFPKAKELYDYLNNLTDLRPDECHLKMLNTLLLSAHKVDEVTMNKNIWNKEELIKKQILGIFIITSTGHFNSLVVDNKTEINIQRHIFEDDRLAHAQSYKSNYNTSDSLVVTVPIKKGSLAMKEHARTRDITVTRLLNIPQKPTMGVVGMKLKKVYLDSLLKDCDGDKCITFDCRYQDNHQCYLLDENGYVVTSNQIQNDTGVFFGYVNGLLMEELVKLNIFKLYTLTDRQAYCKTVRFIQNPDSSASAASIRLKSILKNILSLPFIIAESVRTSLLYVYCFSQTLFAAVASDEFFAPPEQEELFEEAVEESCTKHIHVHLQTSKSVNATGRVQCSSACAKPYAIQSIPHTNMALVVINDVCQGDCSKFIISDDAIRTNQYNKPCAERRKYRKNIPLCFMFKEHNQFCDADRDSNDPHTRIYITAAVTLFLFSSFVFFVMCS